MPEQAPEQKKEEKPKLFDPAVEHFVESFLKSLEQEKVKIVDIERKKAWIRDKVGKGFGSNFLMQTLKAHNFDFDAAGRYIDNIYATQQKSETAVKEVKDIKEERTKEKLTTKRTSQLTWILSSFILSGVGIFIAIILRKQTSDLGDVAGDMGMATSMLENIIKFSWIIAIAAGAVGIFLVVFMLANYFKAKAKKKLGEDVEGKKKAIEEELEAAKPTEKMPEQAGQIQQPAQQTVKTQPPKTA